MTQIYDQPGTHSLNTERPLALPGVNSGSAVSWGAIFAGAVAAASLALMMLMLGTGLGLTSVSPWANHGLSAGTVGIAAIGWLTFTQIVASGMGGYLAGRLRTKWADTHIDEIYFRDTAHGFLTWAVALLLSAMLLTTAAGTLIGGSTKVVGSVASGAASASLSGAKAMSSGATGLSGSSMDYFIHSLFRTGSASPKNTDASAAGSQPTDPLASQAMAHQTVTPAQLGEVSGIFAHAIGSGSLPPQDLQYVAQLISQTTGLSQKEAEQRVQSTYDNVQAKLKEAKEKAQQAADTARKTTSYITLWTFISLLIGAFVASLCATFGGRQRDL